MCRLEVTQAKQFKYIYKYRFIIPQNLEVRFFSEISLEKGFSTQTSWYVETVNQHMGIPFEKKYCSRSTEKNEELVD